MFRLLLWILIIYFLYRLIQSATRISQHRNPPPMPPPPQRGPNAEQGPIGKIEDADFEELPPDPDKKK